MAAGVKAGKTVVRLQTGDVSLYGSVREQGEELTRRGIDWQVVPGVSAFLGAAAELGVEYTVPEVSQSLIITRLEGRTPVPAREQLTRHLRLSRSFIRLPGRKVRPFAAR